MKKVTCLVVDDHPIVCSALSNILDNVDNIEEVVVSNTFRDGLSTIKKRNISLVLLDINLSDGDGFDFLKRARSHGYTGKVIFMSGERAGMHRKLAFKVGADAYLAKTEGREVFAETIKLVIKGYSFFKFDYTNSLNSNNAKLSEREYTVLRFLLKGYSNKKISELLSISEKTVSTHKVRILRKFNVENILALSKVVDNATSLSIDII